MAEPADYSETMTIAQIRWRTGQQHTWPAAVIPPKSPALTCARYARYVRFSFLILMAVLSSLSRDRFLASLDRFGLHTQAESTVTGYRIMVRHLVEAIGNVKLVELKVRDVDFALGKLAKHLSTRSVRLARMILIQAIRNAMVNDLVVRNVADLAAVPAGKPGRPSKSLNLEQARAVLEAAEGERLWPYVAVSMLGGIRTEEARALRWSEVDLEAGTVAVYRSVRRTGKTKTEKSRRVFQIPEIAVEALRELVLKQAADRAKAGMAWRENNLVFCTSLGSPMWPIDVRME